MSGKSFNLLTFLPSVHISLLKPALTKIYLAANQTSSPENWGDEVWGAGKDMIANRILEKFNAEMPTANRSKCVRILQEIFHVSQARRGAMSIKAIVEDKYPDIEFEDGVKRSPVNMAAAAYCRSGDDEWRNFTYEYLKDSKDLTRSWQAFTATPVSDPAGIDVAAATEAFEKEFKAYLTDKYHCGEYIQILPIPAENGVFRAIAYYSEYESEKQGFMAGVGITSIPDNPIRATVFRYYSSNNALEVKAEYNDDRLLKTVTEMFARLFLNAKVTPRSKAKYNLDPLRDEAFVFKTPAGADYTVKAHLSAMKLQLDQNGENTITLACRKETFHKKYRELNLPDKALNIIFGGKILQVSIAVTITLNSLRTIRRTIMLSPQSYLNKCRDTKIDKILRDCIDTWELPYK